MIDFGMGNFHNLISCIRDGHDVYVMSNPQRYQDNPFNYYSSLGITFVEEDLHRDSLIKEWVVEKGIDLVLNTNPRLGHLHKLFESAGVRYLGLTKKSCTIENYKFDVRKSIERLGVSVPNLLPFGTIPCVVKPKIIPQESDHVSICLTKEDVKHYVGDGYYYEEYIPNNIETNTLFIMSKGKWSILHTQEKIGEDKSKLSNKMTHWINTISYKELSNSHTEITIKNSEKILDWCVSVCSESSYIGQITGLIGEDGKWYFCEINVRAGVTNSVPCFISGNDWLKSMDGNPDILMESFPKNIHKMTVIPRSPNSIYPFHLHEKYDVSIPSGLDIIDGEYRTSLFMRHMVKDQRIGVEICDVYIPDEFIDEFKNSDFEVTALFQPYK